MIVTAGNSLRNDDGVGPFIAAGLKQFKNNKFILVDAGMTPENSIDEVISARPGKVVFIDAADFGGAPGEIRIVPEESISDFTLSTHVFPLSAIARIAGEDTGAAVFFICIQITNASLGETICKEVLNSARLIIDFLSN